MKQSRYNFFFEHGNNNMVCYNSRTNALCTIERDLYERYEKYLNGYYSFLSEEEISKFLYGGFLVSKDIDELEILKERMYLDRYDRNRLILTIAPTLKCNFACPYCFEQADKPGNMSTEIQNKIVEFIELRKKDIKHLHIVWYGGEPLLALECIRYLSNKFIDICSKNNIKYTAKIITNGYFLDRNIMEEVINDFKVNSIQVTLDGPAETHNKTRILHDGSPTFDKIINNLKKSKDIIKNIVYIRMNISKQNYLYVDELENILKKEGLYDILNYRLAMVAPNNKIDEEKVCFNSSEFHRIESVCKKRKEGLLYPILKSNFCGADSISAMVIASDGNIYKCWEDVGIKSKAIGNLLSDKDSIIDEKYLFNKYLYTMYDPTNDEKCRECKFLPICMGGCPLRRLENQDRCIEYKYTLKEDLLNILNYKSKTKHYNLDKVTK